LTIEGEQEKKSRTKVIRFTMKLPKSLLILASCSAFVAAETQRTEISVGFEYQLEVNKISITGTTVDVLGNINSNILDALQEALPNGGTESGEELPNVQFSTIDSDIFSACFTKSDQCSLVRSSILISYEGDKPKHSVEYVTLRLVQDYLKTYTKENARVTIGYAYPSMVSTLTQFQMKVVNGKMTSTEVEVMQNTFLEVFGAIVFAIEGDTDILDAKFLYQDLFVIEDRRLQNETNNNSTEIEETKELTGDFTLSTDLQVAGFCRECSSAEFGDIVNGVIINNIPAFQNKLKLNANQVGSTYFDSVSEVAFAVPELPSKLPPIGDETIFDSEPPVTESKHPWFLWFGILMGLIIIFVGGFVIAFSTSESEEDDESYASEEERESDGEGALELDDYQVETVAPNEDGTNSNYEVYVF
jgi:hypothetical protein